MSLSRLWHQQGKRDATRQQLAAVCDRFTAGCDTADLQDARALREPMEDDLAHLLHALGMHARALQRRHQLQYQKRRS
jgi:hypothetical protein